jgi:hypothetical protein
MLDIIGSNPRDFCMLERNFLSHVKLALLFVLFGAAVLLQVRLPLKSSGPDDQDTSKTHSITYILAAIAAAAAIFVILAGYGEYELSFRDIRELRPSFKSTKCALVPFKHPR